VLGVGPCLCLGGKSRLTTQLRKLSAPRGGKRTRSQTCASSPSTTADEHWRGTLLLWRTSEYGSLNGESNRVQHRPLLDTRSLTSQSVTPALSLRSRPEGSRESLYVFLKQGVNGLHHVRKESLEFKKLLIKCLSLGETAFPDYFVERLSLRAH